MITLLLWTLLTAVTLIFVFLPLLKEAYWPFVKGGPLTGLYEEKKTGLWAITDLDTEYEMGKLTPEEYRALREEFKQEVLGVLKEEKKILMASGVSTPKTIHVPVRNRILSEVLRICGKS